MTRPRDNDVRHVPDISNGQVPSAAPRRFGRICVVGLGYVGLPTAAVLAARGVEVIGVDTDAERVRTINAGAVPIVEPDLDRVVAEAVSTGRLRGRETPVPADGFIIAVPTPFDAGRVPDLGCLREAAASLAPVLVRGNLVILESTSPVGTTEALCGWLADARPDLSFPHVAGSASDIRVAYSPERVLPGRILAELVANDRIVGGVTPACATAAAELYGLFLEGACSLTGARTAELVKLAENAYRDVNIAFANEIALVGDALGVDPWETIDLANRHPRVDILRPGPGVGGHCIAVDPWFLVHAQPDLTALIAAARRVNDAMPRRVVDRIQAACRGMTSARIACLGLAYKADVGDLRESPSVAVVRMLAASQPGSVDVVEPHIGSLPEELAEGDRVRLVELDEAVANADVVVLLTDHREFRDIEPDRLTGKRIVDTRGVWR